ncbi:glutamyl-tRNA reductase [Pseudoteredinibacter isoporae]|uniref:Glutamyl-tRNA reductase n=1 Tax=Pseudoteredinibacter isoporae TaxID=570281 RepID=A0A7X0MXE1_9GAMM|nr:glutamyl-tRNA reductase [Pseudoteredinibacter isoporae]MBB6520802.1 glutamyl-tRNA reductase [Pseudoteredinibacter isoporae]NHO86368.1 glutamyl-tRNA reductase [Pseudoteredinibacter isoporae]NIB25180.1 glutamyl-tRNA reductase [Pseudoteredinibacter isoporae]
MLLALGINHNTAPVDIRERVAFAPNRVAEALQAMCDALAIEEAAVLSTCNRTELYTWGEVRSADVLQWLGDFHGLACNALEPYHYALSDAEAIEHMMKVAAGLDSLVLGEPQILGQMKSAYSDATDAGTVGRGLHYGFQQIFNVAKRVRSETEIGANPVSVAFAAVSLAQQIFSDLKEDTALLIGAGETIELVARHLHNNGIKHLIVANRTLERAQLLTNELNGEAILLSDIPEQLPRADIVISSTASQLPLLGKGAVEAALKKRKHKPMFMVDIAVPRDIETQVDELDDVYLYTVDDLRAVIDESRKSREEAAKKAELIVAEGVAQYQAEMRALQAVSTIKAYRQQAEHLRDKELEKALRALESGADAAQTMTQLARALTNKLIHSPTTKLKQASADGRAEVIDISQELLGIDLSKEPSKPH